MLIRRELSSMPMAGVITLGIFLLMYTLITQRSEGVSTDDRPFSIHFGPVDVPIEPDIRVRPRPPEPKKVIHPPEAPRMPTPEVQRLEPRLEFEMPKLDLPGLGDEFLGPVGPGSESSANEAGLVPIVTIRPIYPREAAMRGIEGRVLLEFTITSLGLVKNPRVIEADPRGVFERAATQAILKWKFKPQVENGRPVERVATQEFEFRLDN